MIIQNPKHIIKNFQNRKISIGVKRRENTAKIVLDKQPHFPKTVGYEDIDMEVFDWVDKTFDLVYDGKRLSTYKLFSNQRISEYGQTWKNLDDKGNLDINFKTLTREPNPQKGDIYGGNYTIPGQITFPIFKIKALDENGVEYLETYSMKQPFAVNLIYTVGVFANSYKMLNEMNTKMHCEFKSLERYIFPNGFAMPMELNSVSDESEYTIDDRKYYCQTYQIKVMAFIIREDDYVVTKVPSRIKTKFVSGMNSSMNRNRRKFDIQQYSLTKPVSELEGSDTCKEDAVLTSASKVETVDEIMNEPISGLGIEIEEMCGKQVCWEHTEDELYVNRKILVIATLNYCEPVCEFVSDYNMSVESLELKNVKTYKISVNDIQVTVEDSDVDILAGDTVRIEVSALDEKEDCVVKVLSYDTDSIIKKGEGDEMTTVVV